MIGVMFLAVCIACSVSLLQVYIQLPTDGVINVPSGPQEADYVIRISGSTVMAINSSGHVEFSGTDASTVIQYALDKVAPLATDEAHRKKIFVENGIYDLTDSPTRGVSGSQSDEPGAIWFSYPNNGGGYSYITFEGQSKLGTIFRTNNGPYNAFYLYGKSIEHGDGEDKPNVGLILRSFTIDGGASSEYPKWNVQNGIQTRATCDSLFENLQVQYMGRTAFYNTEHSQTNEWRYNTAFHNYRYGLSYTSSHTGYVHHNNITENQAWGMNWDATFASADNCIFEYNYYRNNAGTDIAMFSEVGKAPLQHGIFRYETIDSTLARKSVAIDWITTDFQMYGCTINHGGTEPAVKIEGGYTNDVNFFDNTINAPNANYCLRVGAGNNAKITGNTFIGKNGIIVASGASNTIIGQLAGQPITNQNDFTAITSNPIEDNGTGTQIGDNIMP